MTPPLCSSMRFEIPLISVGFNGQGRGESREARDTSSSSCTLLEKSSVKTEELVRCAGILACFRSGCHSGWKSPPSLPSTALDPLVMAKSCKIRRSPGCYKAKTSEQISKIPVLRAACDEGLLDSIEELASASVLAQFPTCRPLFARY
jgi:hypothetical protein